MQKLLNIAELSDLLGVTKATIYSWTSQNKIPHIKLGKRLLKFREDEIMSWIEKCSVGTDANNAPARSHKAKQGKAAQAHSDDFIERIISRAKEEILA